MIMLVACASVDVPRGAVTLQPAQCEPTDQDAYVYSPDRLEVLSPCIRVSGIVQGVSFNPFDGDALVELKVDAEFERYLTRANQVERGGNLHVEIVCFSNSLIMNSHARSACAQDPDPLRGFMPAIGQHVRMEGRWVLDHSHGGYAELHPLYRWEALK